MQISHRALGDRLPTKTNKEKLQIVIISTSRRVPTALGLSRRSLVGCSGVKYRENISLWLIVEPSAVSLCTVGSP